MIKMNPTTEQTIESEDIKRPNYQEQEEQFNGLDIIMRRYPNGKKKYFCKKFPDFSNSSGYGYQTKQDLFTAVYHHVNSKTFRNSFSNL